MQSERSLARFAATTLDCDEVAQRIMNAPPRSFIEKRIYAHLLSHSSGSSAKKIELLDSFLGPAIDSGHSWVDGLLAAFFACSNKVALDRIGSVILTHQRPGFNEFSSLRALSYGLRQQYVKPKDVTELLGAVLLDKPHLFSDICDIIIEFDIDIADEVVSRAFRASRLSNTKTVRHRSVFAMVKYVEHVTDAVRKKALERLCNVASDEEYRRYKASFLKSKSYRVPRTHQPIHVPITFVGCYLDSSD